MIKLNIPDAIFYPNAKYIAVKITNNGFSYLGLSVGYIALVLVGEVSNGDFAAVEEKSSNGVMIGFVEKAVDSIFIEDGDQDFEVFGQSEVNIIGKVVGRFKMNPNDYSTRYFVETLNPIKKEI